MKALFIGQAYIDITFLADQIPTGDEKAIAQDYAVSFGGNAVTAAFCCAKAQSSQGISASTSAVSTVAPHQMRRPAGASR